MAILGAQVHVISVGTSVYTNACREGRRPGMPAPDAEAEIAQRTWELQEVLGAYVQGDPYRASAELHAMAPFLEDHAAGRAVVAWVHLVHTDTAVGRLCAAVLEQHLQGRGIRQVTHLQLPAYRTLRAAPGDPEPSAAFVEGLVAIRDRLLHFVRARQQEGHDVLLNATGGFKPEAAVLVLVGGLAAVPVYYVHEVFHQTVLLPPLCLPHERAARLAGYLAQLPATGRVAGPEARRFHRALQEAGLWEEALRLRVVRAETEEGEEAPFAVALTAIGKYVLAAHGEGGARRG